ncbi:MAG TPA: flagellar motor protein MotB [Thermohalobaculum sp.]|nr:flagellar motor protein MotB [Thermohalobaculum sp.]
MAAKNELQPIIIKRKKVVGGGGHHGGAWKVAYADFVTAMMAFFLLMWLLNATTEDQRKGLADYFTPNIPISRTSAGGAGMLAGVTIFSAERAADIAEQGDTPKPVRRDPQKEAAAGAPDANQPGEMDATAAEAMANAATEPPSAEGTLEAIAEAPGAAVVPTPEDLAGAAAERAERERLEQIGRKIAEAMSEAQDGALQRHFILHMTPEGLVIEIIDAADQPLFASASAKPAAVLETLMDVLVPVLETTLNGIAVVGHTDAVPFGGEGYSNWELSADRANAARRMLARRGLPENRVVRVTGKAAVEPLVPDPNAAQNRRIAITLLRDSAR